MSSTGNRSNPNETRMAGHRDGKDRQSHTNESGTPEIGRQGGATHRETREHNKHNEPGQGGHKPQSIARPRKSTEGALEPSRARKTAYDPGSRTGSVCGSELR